MSEHLLLSETDFIKGYDQAVTKYAQELFTDCEVIFVPQTRTIQFAFTKALQSVNPSVEKTDYVFVQRLNYMEFDASRRIRGVGKYSYRTWCYPNQDTMDEVISTEPYLPVNIMYQIDVFIENGNMSKINNYMYRSYISKPSGDYVYLTILFEDTLHPGLSRVAFKFDGITQGEVYETDPEAFRTKIRYTESLTAQAWLPRKSVKNPTFKQFVELDDVTTLK
jgi:hypothetical protein